jgi:hypothetical protein
MPSRCGRLISGLFKPFTTSRTTKNLVGTIKAFGTLRAQTWHRASRQSHDPRHREEAALRDRPFQDPGLDGDRVRHYAG